MSLTYGERYEIVRGRYTEALDEKREHTILSIGCAALGVAGIAFFDGARTEIITGSAAVALIANNMATVVRNIRKYPESNPHDSQPAEAIEISAE